MKKEIIKKNTKTLIKKNKFNILAKGKGLAFVGEEWLHSLMNQEATTFTP